MQTNDDIDITEGIEHIIEDNEKESEESTETNTEVDEKPQCSKCNKTFSCQYSLERHTKSVHKGRKREAETEMSAVAKKTKVNYQCDVCGKKVMDNWVLKRHKNTH